MKPETCIKKCVGLFYHLCSGALFCIVSWVSPSIVGGYLVIYLVLARQQYSTGVNPKAYDNRMRANYSQYSVYHFNYYYE